MDNLQENSFGRRLKELRRERRLLQEDVSKVVGVSRQSIGCYEMGKSEPDIDSIRKIAAFFKVSTDYLLCVTDVRKRRISNTKGE